MSRPAFEGTLELLCCFTAMVRVHVACWAAASVNRLEAVSVSDKQIMSSYHLTCCRRAASLSDRLLLSCCSWALISARSAIAPSLACCTSALCCCRSCTSRCLSSRACSMYSSCKRKVTLCCSTSCSLAVEACHFVHQGWHNIFQLSKRLHLCCSTSC